MARNHRFTDVAALPTLEVGNRSYRYVPIAGVGGAATLPYSLKILLENVLRTVGDDPGGQRYVEALASWDESAEPGSEIPFSPSRVLLQDMAGTPVVHDLVAMREAVQRLGGDPTRVSPRVPAELVVDHSVIVDHFGNREALRLNVELEYERNRERYQFLRWAQTAFDNFSVVPPGTGIVHQVNIEHLARCVMTVDVDGEQLAYPDTCVGTDSHTTMVNGLGVLGWGVGGIEASGSLLGQPISILVPRVVGVEVVGVPPTGVTTTDVVLTVTEFLRDYGVVGSIVEFYGPGLAELSVADRATIGNMSPEFGSTAAMFPIDELTLDYLRLTGRPREHVELIRAYAKAQGLWSDGSRTPTRYSEYLQLDLASVVPAIAGPRRPQDRIVLSRAKEQFGVDLPIGRPDVNSVPPATVHFDGRPTELRHGAVAIAAITSCTNTSNPTVMMSAALLARNAVERGLTVPPWVKTSMAPGSQVVTRYLDQAGLLPFLDRLGFQVVGYGCTTCMGNSGPLPEEMSRIAEHGTVLTSVLSGNRNFEGRINPDVEMSYLASPPLVIAYALAGTMDIDLVSEPIGRDLDGAPVHLADLWPTAEEVERTLSSVVTRDMYLDAYIDPFAGSRLWQELPVLDSEVFVFDDASTYLKQSPFFASVDLQAETVDDIVGARALAVLGDSVTTDHISPVGAIRLDSPAGRYLAEHGVERRDFNSYGSRRGNHEVMVRGTFANVRLRNRLVDGVTGGFTRDFTRGGEQTTIFEAAQAYEARAVPLVVLAGKEYGSGSARDWAAKGTKLLGVRAVLAESFERIHRSNLVGMGVMPLQFVDGDSVESLGLEGTEELTIRGLAAFGRGEHPRTVHVEATAGDGAVTPFDMVVRIDTPTEADYLRHGGILPAVLRSLVS